MPAPGAFPDARAWLEEADRLHQEKQFGPAARHYRRALTCDESLFEAWYGLGCAEASAGEFGAAIPALHRALKLRPDATRLRINLAEALFGLGYASESVREYLRAAAEGDPETRALASRNIACIAPGDLAMDNAAIMRARLLWAGTVEADARPVRLNRAPGARLRVGYYGAFFNARNWMKMYIGVINAHDRDRFEVTMIADGELPSAEAGYRDCPDDRVWHVTGIPNHELAGHIAEYGLDVLVDMNGYSHQTRMGLLAFRSAPVQIAWSGMYGTTGFSAVDCVIGDAWSIPPEEDKFCVERVRRVPHTYLAFDTFYEAPDIAPPPHALCGHVTFGSLISGYKVTPEVIACWSRILHGVAGSRLLLRNRMLDRESNRADVIARFAANGVEAGRLLLEGGGAHDAFLRTYDRIDIALDAFPYSGATTTAEALWQGVPVLTFNGDRWAARTSRSILMAAGLGEWVAPDQQAFEAIAIGLGLAPEGLTTIRAVLRGKVAASPACDTEGLCRSLEAIYREELAKQR